MALPTRKGCLAPRPCSILTAQTDSRTARSLCNSWAPDSTLGGRENIVDSPGQVRQSLSRKTRKEWAMQWQEEAAASSCIVLSRLWNCTLRNFWGGKKESLFWVVFNNLLDDTEHANCRRLQVASRWVFPPFPCFPPIDLQSDLGSPIYLSGRSSLLHIFVLESDVSPAAWLQLQISALQGSNYFTWT